MNYNGYSVILSTLKLQGSLTRPQIWHLVRQSNLFQSSLNFKSKLDTLLSTERINRTSEYQYDAKRAKQQKELEERKSKIVEIKIQEKKKKDDQEQQRIQHALKKSSKMYKN
ncbi:hypothetical protein PPL_08094 [Heterostelium album PN500]|uniref:Uncharacterized protein n=1 Tax=Heterostelium pallidum (strain ATCC 26659 / Pp 5 / PN500) TaxID=670386 RepID=D3BIL5_HETP5|nr:hypothetical protein PPL_08094 [Heterostelium album PN500]EFA78639.1 hypothetical protein PPL_08094 [Heterostelium album PN500]|eukprot:XP_020430763.1 hypothetical protein PPL_08094 [Heterostelium album PN500]